MTCSFPPVARMKTGRLILLVPLQKCMVRILFLSPPLVLSLEVDRLFVGSDGSPASFEHLVHLLFAVRFSSMMSLESYPGVCILVRIPEPLKPFPISEVLIPHLAPIYVYWGN